MQKPVRLLFRRKRQQFMTFQSTRFAAAEIRGDINKKLRELGALTYKIKLEVHGTDNSQQIKLIVSEISDLKDNLDVSGKRTYCRGKRSEKMSRMKCCYS